MQNDASDCVTYLFLCSLNAIHTITLNCDRHDIRFTVFGGLHQGQLKVITEYKLFSANEGRASCHSFKDLLKYMFENDFHNVYSSLFKLLKICATIPITSSECERTHSKVARVKSAVRCSMTDDRLEHLVLVNVEQDIANNLGLSSLVDVFKLAGPKGERRVKL